MRINTFTKYFANLKFLLAKKTIEFNRSISSKFAVNTNYEKYEDNYIPFQLAINGTNICNANCSFCAYRYSLGKEKKGIMNFDVFKKAVDEYVEIGGKNILFTPTIGEALLDNNLFEKINYVTKNEKIKYVFLNTNGINLIKNENYKKIIDSGIDAIFISTAGFDESIYEKIYGSKQYKLHLEGVHNLLKYNLNKNQNVKITIGFRSPLKPSKIMNTPDFNEKIKHFIKNVKLDFLGKYDNWGGMITKENLFGVMELKKESKNKKIPCSSTFGQLAVLFDGSIRLCGCRIKTTIFDDLVIGNIKNKSLKEIIYGEKAKKVRASFKSGNYIDVCKNCTWYKPISEKDLKKMV